MLSQANVGIQNEGCPPSYPSMSTQMPGDSDRFSIIYFIYIYCVSNHRQSSHIDTAVRFSVTTMLSATHTTLANQLCSGRPMRTGKQSSRSKTVVRCAAPSPAWPGRAVVPEKTATRDGPKVRDTLWISIPHTNVYILHWEINASMAQIMSRISYQLLSHTCLCTCAEILAVGIHWIYWNTNIGDCRRTSRQIRGDSSVSWI